MFRAIAAALLAFAAILGAAGAASMGGDTAHISAPIDPPTGGG